MSICISLNISGRRNHMVQKEERFVGFVWLTPEQLKKVKMKPAVYEIVEENRGIYVSR
jgi:hypothetical protein